MMMMHEDRSDKAFSDDSVGLVHCEATFTLLHFGLKTATDLVGVQ